MADIDPGRPEKKGKQSKPLAFILFRRQSEVSKGELSYSEESWRILTSSLPSSKVGSDPLLEISSLCSGWVKSLERGPTEGESDFIDIILSGRRRYGVRGVVLAGQSEKKKQYLFILERTSFESAHLEILFRHYRLSSREKDIVRLLLAGNCNKEIASSLGLTLNTVKGYMKLLTRKLGVSGRSGIVAAFVERK